MADETTADYGQHGQADTGYIPNMQSLKEKIPPLGTCATILRCFDWFLAFVVMCAVPPSPPSLPILDKNGTHVDIGAHYSGFSFMIATAVFIWLLCTAHLFFAHTNYGVTTAASLRGALQQPVPVLGKVSPALASFAADAMLMFWAFLAFASAASQFSHDVAPGVSLKETAEAHGKMATGIAFTFFLWLTMIGSTICSWQNYKVDQGVQGDLDASLTGAEPNASGQLGGSELDPAYDAASGQVTVGDNKVSMAYQDL